MPASTAIRAATKRIESLLSMFLFLTTGELIAPPPLIVRLTIPRFSPRSNSSLRSGLWLRHRIVELRDEHAFVRARVVAERFRPLHQDFLPRARSFLAAMLSSVPVSRETAAPSPL